jgi:protein-S-isoprenylcysteine O-methyltransferase Ste14
MIPSFWIILLAILTYGLVHSWLASLMVKAQARRRFGPAANRWFRLVYNLIALITLLPVLFLPVVLIDRPIYTIRLPWLALTIALQLLSVSALVIGVAQTGIGSFLGIKQVITGKEEPSTRLVIDGLYRWVRHPLYTAGLVFIWFMPVMTWNLLAINLGITLYIVIGALFEERKLQREFGEAYAAYKQRTPMLIPGLHQIGKLFRKNP